jgi:hypothetical protein
MVEKVEAISPVRPGQRAVFEALRDAWKLDSRAK